MAAPLPETRFDACVIRLAAPVDKYQTVAFERNRYSTPRPFAFRTVTVKGYADRVVIVADGRAIASHERSLRRGTTVLDPVHYLATLGRRPAALDHAPVYRDWALPACFAALRSELEAHHGTEAGARRFVRVLQLLGEHPLDRVRRAVEACQLDQAISAEAITERTRGLAAIESRTGAAPLAAPGAGGPPPVHVPRPDLRRFNQLLSGPVGQGEAPEEARTIRADAIPPEGQSHIVFA